jgi:hypothetical protein
MTPKKQPPVAVFLPREVFSFMLSPLDFFIANEKILGKNNFFVKNSVRLKSKILKYSRAYKDAEIEKVSVYFYEIEAAVLIKLLSYYVSLNENRVKDYYHLLKKRREKNGV